MVKNDKVEDDVLCKKLSNFIVTSNPEVHVDLGELEKKEAKTKACSLIENDICKKKCGNEKHEDSLWPREKNKIKKLKSRAIVRKLVRLNLFCLQNKIFFTLYTKELVS